MYKIGRNSILFYIIIFQDANLQKKFINTKYFIIKIIMSLLLGY